MAGRSVYSLFSWPLQRLFRTPSMYHVEYFPCLDNNGRVLWTNLAQNRNMTTTPSLGNSTRKGKVDGGLDGILRLGKSSKKQRSKGKYLKQNGDTRKQNDLLFPSCKSEYRNSCVAKKQNEKGQHLIPSTKHKPKSSFLSSLSKQQRLTYHIGKPPSSVLLNTEGTSSRVGREIGAGKQAATRPGLRDEAVVSMATNTLYSTNSIKPFGSVDKEKLDVIKNHTAVRENPFGFEMDKNDSRVVGLDTWGLDLVGDACARENYWAQQSLPAAQTIKHNKKEKNKDRDISVKEALESNDNKRGVGDISGQLKNNELSEEMCFSGYEHLLYNEARYPNDGVDSGAEQRIGEKRVPTTVKGKKSLKNIMSLDHVSVPPSTIQGSQHNISLSTDKGATLKINTENKQLPTTPGNANDSSTSFILVDECFNNTPETRKTEKKKAIITPQNKRIDSLLQTLQNDRWENLVQRKLEQQNTSLPYEYINNESRFYCPSKAEIPDENASKAQDQMEDYVFGSKQKDNVAGSVSTVPDNTALLNMNQVCVEELKPDLKREATRLIFHNDKENRLVPEPMLIIQPNEIRHRKKPKASTSHIRLDDSYNPNTAPPSQHGRKGKTSRHSLADIEDKGAWQKRHLLSAGEIAQQKSVVVGKEQSRKKIEIWSSSKLWDRIKEREAKKSKYYGSLGDCFDKSDSLTDNDMSWGFTNGKLNGTASAENVKKTSNILNKQSQLSREVREKLKQEFQKNFLEMQRDELLKMSLNSKPSKLISNPNNYAKWISERLDGGKTYSPVDKKGAKMLPSSNSLQENVYALHKDKKNKIALENWQDDYLDPYEEWARYQEKRYHDEFMSQKSRKKSKKKSKKSKLASSTTDFPDSSTQNMQSKSHDSKTFEFDSSIKTTVQKSNGLDNKSFIPLSGQYSTSRSSEKWNRLPTQLERLDGLMTITVEPVLESPSVDATNHDKAIKRLQRTSSKALANQMSSLRFLSTNQEPPTKSPTQGTFQDIQLERYMSAMRRYHDRIEKEKEDKKKKRRKKRNLAEHSRTKRNVSPGTSKKTIL